MTLLGSTPRPPRRLRSGAAITALAVALVLTAVGCDLEDLNAEIHDQGDAATSSTLNSGANGASVTLADGRIVFLANDAYVGAVTSGGARAAGGATVRNALVVHDPSEGSTVTRLGAGRTAYLESPSTSTHYSLGTAVTGSSDIQVFVQERSTATGAVTGLRVIQLLQSSLAVGSQAVLPFQANGPVWGQHVFKRGSYWYVYGYTEGATPRTYVARTPTGNLTVASSWRFWNGTAWVAAPTEARAIRDESGQIVERALTPAYRAGSPMAFLGRQPVGTSPDLYLYSAPGPAGPVTVGSTPAASAPEWAQSCGAGGVGTLNYHPDLTEAGDPAAFSYSRPCSAPTTPPAEYRPTFIGVDLAAQPALPAWRASWASGLNRVDPAFAFYGPYRGGFVNNRSIRHGVHLTRGGATVRIRISNQFGPGPLLVGAASIARSSSAESSDAAVTTTPVPLTFAGQASVTIPPGQIVTSDRVTLPAALPHDHDASVTLYLPEGADQTVTGHLNQGETSRVGVGNLTASTGSGFTEPSTNSGYFLAGVDVLDAAVGGTVVAIGDSITNGFGTTDDEETRYTDALYDKLKVSGPARTVVNLGISGSTLNRWGETDPNSVLGRFDRDVLGQAGVRSVIVWIGINDITVEGATASNMRSGLTEAVLRAHEAGLKVFLMTVTPLRGPDDPPLTPSQQNQEAVRQSINHSIRTDAFDADGYVDADAVVRDPGDPTEVKLAYANNFAGDRGNHLNDVGSTAVGTAVFNQLAPSL